MSGKQSCKTFPFDYSMDFLNDCRKVVMQDISFQLLDGPFHNMTGKQSCKTFPFDFAMDSLHNDMKAVMQGISF